jgi:hypothetical protein
MQRRMSWLSVAICVAAASRRQSTRSDPNTLLAVQSNAQESRRPALAQQPVQIDRRVSRVSFLGENSGPSNERMWN